MSTITLEGLTPAQKAVIDMFIREGKLQAYEELINYFDQELHKIAPEDSHFGEYISYVIEEIDKRFKALSSE